MHAKHAAMQLSIRLARAADRATLLDAVEQLQQAEHLLHDSRRPGREVARRYLRDLERWVAKGSGATLIAEQRGRFVGFVACWINWDRAVIETDESNAHGYISDIFVVPEQRGRGVAARLIAAAEAFLRKRGATRVRINALAVNRPAVAAYRKSGYRPYEVAFEKRLG
jgi:ribosomal protein S18 acetylase RimI-like enzyme